MDVLSQLTPEEVLTKGSVAKYEEGRKFFWLGQMVPLNASIYIVERIQEFPFDVFATAPWDTLFFKLVVHNFLNSIVVTISRLVDPHHEAYTLTKFKKTVLKLVRTEYSDAFRKRLRDAKFDKTTLEIQERVKNVRDEIIAHLDREVFLGDRPADRVTFSEIKQLADALNCLLRTLFFGSDVLMLPVCYDPSVQHPEGTKTDIEQILDDFAKRHPMLTLPDDQPYEWEQSLRKRFTGSQISKLNFYRRKFGLPEVT
ncbi:MAG: hypothetical protein L6435_02890 [Anaerolineae bacterium]|nr:hypothetical protein [Anaerolineae bacterium]